MSNTWEEEFEDGDPNAEGGGEEEEERESCPLCLEELVSTHSAHQPATLAI